MGHQFLGDALHLIIGAHAGDNDVGVLRELGQTRCRSRARGHGCRHPVLVHVVGDDVEAGGRHVPGHRQPHVADPDDPDHLLPFLPPNAWS